jgi:hypothetical protein
MKEDTSRIHLLLQAINEKLRAIGANRVLSALAHALVLAVLLSLYCIVGATIVRETWLWPVFFAGLVIVPLIALPITVPISASWNWNPRWLFAVGALSYISSIISIAVFDIYLLKNSAGMIAILHKVFSGQMFPPWVFSVIPAIIYMAELSGRSYRKRPTLSLATTPSCIEANNNDTQYNEDSQHSHGTTMRDDVLEPHSLMKAIKANRFLYTVIHALALSSLLYLYLMVSAVVVKTAWFWTVLITGPVIIPLVILLITAPHGIPRNWNRPWLLVTGVLTYICTVIGIVAFDAAYFYGNRVSIIAFLYNTPRNQMLSPWMFGGIATIIYMGGIAIRAYQKQTTLPLTTTNCTETLSTDGHPRQYNRDSQRLHQATIGEDMFGLHLLIQALKAKLRTIGANRALSALAHALILAVLVFSYNMIGEDWALKTDIGWLYIFFFFPGLIIIPLLALGCTKLLGTFRNVAWLITTALLTYILTIGSMVLLTWLQAPNYSSEHGIISVVLDVFQTNNPLSLWGAWGIPTVLYMTGLTIRAYRKRPNHSSIPTPAKNRIEPTTSSDAV